MAPVPLPVRILLIALVFGWPTTRSSTEKPGNIALLFVLLLLAALFTVGRLEGVPVVRGDAGCWGPTLLFCAVGLANATFTLLNVATVLVLLSLLIYFMLPIM